MNYVHLSGPNNSTMFTNCCNTAICDNQAFCPVCKTEIYPGADATDHQRNRSRWEYAYGPQRRTDRHIKRGRDDI